VSGNNNYTPSISTSTTYYAQARIAATGCVSATRIPVEALLTPAPMVAYNPKHFGARNQIRDQGSAVTPITYEGVNATDLDIAWGSTGIPAGMYCTKSGTHVYIGGIPSNTGTYNYSVTANSAGCVSDTTSGTYTVIPPVPPPPAAASTLTWQIDNQVWSDVIIAEPSQCSSTMTLVPSNTSVPQYKKCNNDVYYNYRCVSAARNSLCPSPWRVPTTEDALSLMDFSSTPPALFTLGTGGYALYANCPDRSEFHYYWLDQYMMGENSYILRVLSNASFGYTTMTKGYGLQVRCVR
jgi:hypothetical protein